MSELYNPARTKFATGALSWEDDDVRGVLVDSSLYPFDADHGFLSDIPVGARLAFIPTLTGKTWALGVADADDTEIAGPVNSIGEYVILYKYNADPASAALIARITDAQRGLPVNVTSQDVTVTWDNGPNKIFKL